VERNALRFKRANARRGQIRSQNRAAFSEGFGIGKSQPFGEIRRMDKPARQSLVPLDLSPTGEKANGSKSEHTPTLTGQQSRRAAADSLGEATAHESVDRLRARQRSASPKRPPRKSGAVSDAALGDAIPGWARHDPDTRDQSIVRPIGPKGRRPRRDDDLPRADQVRPTDVARTRPAPLLTVAQTAEFLNVSPRTIRRLIAKCELTVVRIGRSVRVRPAALERLMLCGSGGRASEGQGGDEGGGRR
jgi:excisionase family DNA binding protein